MDVDGWDLVIAHPPCTYLSHVNTRGHSKKQTTENRIIGNTLERINAMDFFMRIMTCNSPRIAVENPVGVMNSVYRQPDQIIEPYQFCEDVSDSEYVTKRTCLWLKNLPLLQGNQLPRPNNKEKYGVYSSGKTKTWEDCAVRTSKERSKTFKGIAKAMAEQWG